ncbi:MAG: cystathionine beta-synthase [Chloroflexota bacterium]|nr:cystathionine beta-synthase [Chloroflexota bacterium]
MATIRAGLASAAEEARRRLDGDAAKDGQEASLASDRQRRVFENVIEALGDTPLVRLNSVTKDIRTPIYAKMEMLNPGGSVKDRIGIRMIEEAERRGWLRPGGTIVEPTSGNTGVGLAMAASVRGYRCIFVMPDKVSAEKVQLLRAYGAEVVTTPTAVERDSPESYYSVADRLTREVPNAFQPNQYFNPMNPKTHYLATGPEIWEQTEGRITHFVAGVGTGGTISGVGRYLRERNPGVKIVGADPEGSIYTSPIVHQYKVEGVGEDFWPGTFDRKMVDDWIQVSDIESFLMARRMTREEGILVGGSCGLAVHAAVELGKQLDDPEALIVVLLPDSGRGYLSKIYNDDWMRENGYISRFTSPSRMGNLVDGRTGRVPHVVAVGCHQTVAAAIELLREYEVSQLPVVRGTNPVTNDPEDCVGPEPGEPIEVHGIVGSLQERMLLDHVFRNPDVLGATVSSIMDAPFSLVDANEDIERIIPMLAANSPAVLVQRNGILIGVITRADILEYVADHRPSR